MEQLNNYSKFITVTRLYFTYVAAVERLHIGSLQRTVYSIWINPCPKNLELTSVLLNRFSVNVRVR